MDIGSISVTDDLREAIIDKVNLLISGSSTLHIELKLGKDSENVTMDVEASSYTFSGISINLKDYLFRCTCTFLKTHWHMDPDNPA